MSPKGTHNHIIKAAIAAGMRLEGGNLVLPTGTTYKGSELGEGYHRVTLRHGGKKIEVTRARIVCWLAHGEPPTPQHQADHINRVRNDDRPENLRWATPAENVSNVSDSVRSERSAKMRARHDEVARLRASHAALVEALEKIYAETTTPERSVKVGLIQTIALAALKLAQ